MSPDLALAAVPEMIGRVTLLEKGNAVRLEDPKSLKAELESMSKVRLFCFEIRICVISILELYNDTCML